MDAKERLLLENIESLRSRIDAMRNEIWLRDRANIASNVLVSELEELLHEYLMCIRKHENMIA